VPPHPVRQLQPCLDNTLQSHYKVYLGPSLFQKAHRAQISKMHGESADLRKCLCCNAGEKDPFLRACPPFRDLARAKLVSPLLALSPARLCDSLATSVASAISAQREKGRRLVQLCDRDNVSYARRRWPCDCFMTSRSSCAWGFKAGLAVRPDIFFPCIPRPGFATFDSRCQTTKGTLTGAMVGLRLPTSASGNTRV
jgi:hypothetical protein